MLHEVIKDVLQLSAQSAQAFLALLALEKHRLGKDFFYELIQDREPSTSDELLTFIERLGQTAWFHGHDRSQFPATLERLNKAAYARVFSGLGLMQSIPYDLTTLPHFSVILGSSAWQMRQRVKFLLSDLKQGVQPSQRIIFGLASHRPLGVSSVDPEQEEKQQLIRLKMPVTEMNLLNLLMTKMLSHFNKTTSTIFYYWPIETHSGAADRSKPYCVTTVDTIYSLQAVLRREFSSITVPRRILFYSQQPYILRQQRDITQVLGKDRIHCVGRGVNSKYFYQAKSLSIMLGEVARLIHQAYCKKTTTCKKLSASDRQALKQLLDS